jgi:hypothetical protein
MIASTTQMAEMLNAIAFCDLGMSRTGAVRA